MVIFRVEGDHQEISEVIFRTNTFYNAKVLVHSSLHFLPLDLLRQYLPANTI